MTGPVIADITVRAAKRDRPDGTDRGRGTDRDPSAGADRNRGAGSSDWDGGGLEMRFTFPTTGEVVDLPLPEGRARALREKAGIYLARVARQAARLNASTGAAADALHTLHGAGGELIELLAPDRRFLRLQDAFRRAWPLWQQPDWSDPDQPLPVVQVNCREHTFPLELLPVFDLGPMPEPTTHDARVRAASRFLGFTAQVRRTVATSTDADRLIRNDPVLPVQFLRHRGLFNAVQEEGFLASLTDHVRVDGPWPMQGDEKEVRAALIEALYTGRSMNGGPPVQIHHFACHCDTTTRLDDDYTLRLSTKRGGGRNVSLGQLRRAYRERYALDRDDRQHRAIVILNACASSHTDPLTAASFAQWFVASGHRAFIGTETDVPDAVAAGFAGAFYGRLLESRRALGDAVVWARRDLLRDFRNPLGLLYVVYGDTDLRVERARPGVYRSMN